MTAIRKLFFLFACAFASLSLGGCTVFMEDAPSHPTVVVPLEVYVYPEGCWADGLWYTPCPWSVPRVSGYYVREHKRWRFYPDRRWERRDVAPPPRWFEQRSERFSPPPRDRAAPPQRRSADPRKAEPRHVDRGREEARPPRPAQRDTRSPRTSDRPRRSADPRRARDR